MLEWKRTKYLARGCFIQEVATTGKQSIIAEWVIKNGKPEPRVKYYQDDILIKGFKIEAIDIEDLKVKAYIAVREYINEQIAETEVIIIVSKSEPNLKEIGTTFLASINGCLALLSSTLP